VSLNLTLGNKKGAKFELRQTPSFVTKMCLSFDPVKETIDGGKNGVLRRYLAWCDSFMEKDEYKQHEQSVFEFMREHPSADWSYV